MLIVRKKHLILCLSLAACGLLAWKAATSLNWNPAYEVGEEIDSLNGVAVYYNGGVAHTDGRNLAPDGYNLGIRYQCVEFVKRYYYEHLDHRMPDTYGHAKHFFGKNVPDGGMNIQRALLQFTNGSRSRPQPDDLIIFRPTLLNRYGHVAIIADVTANEVEIIQQNPGPFGSSRERFPLLQTESGTWTIGHNRVMGWLRKERSSQRSAS